MPDCSERAREIKTTTEISVEERVRVREWEMSLPKGEGTVCAAIKQTVAGKH